MTGPRERLQGIRRKINIDLSVRPRRRDRDPNRTHQLTCAALAIDSILRSWPANEAQMSDEHKQLIQRDVIDPLKKTDLRIEAEWLSVSIAIL